MRSIFIPPLRLLGWRKMKGHCHSMKSSEDAEYLALTSVDRIVGVRTARHTRERAGGTAGAP